MQGKIKWFNPTKGYGFITSNEDSKDIFLHISALEVANITELQEGQEVTFEIDEHKGKSNAIDIKIV